MTTQELVERLKSKAEDQAHEASEDRSDGFEYEASIHDKDADFLRAAASRLSEMEAENKRLREALKEQLGFMRLWFDDVECGVKPYLDGFERAEKIIRAALDHDKGEPLP